jgi:transcriptional regulator with XRE-family HTH domain
METPYERLMQLIAEARKRQRLERQIDLARVSGLSKSTIYRLDKGQELSDSALRDVSKALGWTADSAERILAGGEPVDAEPAEATLEARYRREPLTDGQLTQAFEDALYEALIVAAPDTPLSQIDKARKAAFKVLRRNGIEVAHRHYDDQSGKDDEL